jgi:hypothetical protein
MTANETTAQERTAALPRSALVSWSWWAATGLLVSTLVLLGVDVMVWAGQRFEPPPVSFIQGQATYVAEMVLVVAYSAMGWLLASRLPRNPLGWIFLEIAFVFALQMAITFAVQAGHQAFRPLDPLALAGAWLVSTVHLPSLILSFAFLFLLFPDGRPLTRRWGLVGWVGVVGTVLVCVGVGLSSLGLIWYPTLPNPFAAPRELEPALLVIAMTGLALVVVGVVGSAASMVVRYRRVDARQKAQLRWVAVAVVILTLCGLPFVIGRYALNMRYAEGELLMLIALVGGGFLPIAAAIAVLRRRLYDIDLILNRALVYIPLTGILGGLYAAGVAFFQRVFIELTGNRSDMAIIITTLVLASLFTPIRNHLQAFVDRRFKPPSEDADAEEDAIEEAEDAAVAARLHELEERLRLLETRRNL